MTHAQVTLWRAYNNTTLKAAEALLTACQELGPLSDEEVEFGRKLSAGERAFLERGRRLKEAKS